MTVWGQILICIGFLMGALAAAMERDAIQWQLYSGGIILGVIGVVIAWSSRKRHAKSGTILTHNIDAIGSSLEILAGHARQLDQEKENIFVYDMHRKIDDLFPEPLDRFVQARESMIHAFSMNDYAEVMNHFAAGERGINRAWSASVDGYVDEVKQTLPRAADHFRVALETFRKLRSGSG